MYKCGITGATGVLGQYFISNTNYDFYIFKGDITNKEKVEKWVKSNEFDFIVHLAAKVATIDVKKNLTYAKKVNFDGTKNIIDSIIKHKKKIKLFFFASTSHVYDLKYKKSKIKENSKLKPSSLYGKTKLSAEKYILKKNKFSKFNFCIGRIFSFTHEKQSRQFLVPNLFYKIANYKNKTIKLNNLTHYRDFVDLKDISKAIRIICEKKLCGVYNIGTGKGTYLPEIANYFNFRYKKNLIYEKNNKITYLIADINKLKKKGWIPKRKITFRLNKFK